MAETGHPFLLLFAFLSLFFTCTVGAGVENKALGVTYDSRSLIINGERELLFSGSIHYTRSSPEMWPNILKKAKEGGLNVIQTYIFWNIHEPIKGQFNFEGNYDFIKFIKMVGEHELYLTLRLGPYIEAEWNLGGFPYWLREVPNITFRSYNEPFMFHMKNYTEMIINMVKKEKLFAPQGGPIIMAQIENEYNNVQLAYKEDGVKYIHWAANMAVNTYNGVPWIMCKQKEAPDVVINTCNGRHCGDTFSGPNGPNKPSLWTENWTAQYRVFGDPPSQRAAEDIAYAVARFFSKNGTLTNYYMYHGGTNFGRTSSSFVSTRYYDEAPLDEYGLKREPKFGHLRDLHRSLRLCRKALLWGTPRVEHPAKKVEIITYELPEQKVCAAFLTNTHARLPAMVNFRGVNQFLPAKSISILPDCKTVVYNTQTVTAQHNIRNFVDASNGRKFLWEMFQETIPIAEHLPIKNKSPLELYTLTKDTSDYAWYSTSIKLDKTDLPMKLGLKPVLQIASLGHAMLAFVNGQYIGFEHGSNIEKSFVFQKPLNLTPGVAHISLLGMTVGFPNSGAFMERRFAGPRAVTIQGLNTGTLDVTLNSWGHRVGVEGEKLQLYTEEGLRKVKWNTVANPSRDGPPLTWYKTHFDAPPGNEPVALMMKTMGKGMAWVNGKGIGRYWSSYLSPLGQPTQSEYHVPRAFLKPTNNLLVVFEETGGRLDDLRIATVNRDTICSFVGETNPTPVGNWDFKNNQLRPVVEDEKTGAHLSCPEDKAIKTIDFASFGNPDGACGLYKPGTCDSPNSKRVVEQKCLGKSNCAIPLEREVFGEKSNDPCPDIIKTLAVQVTCGFR